MQSDFPELHMDQPRSHRWLFAVCGLVIGILVAVAWESGAPARFVPGTTVTIPEGSTVRAAAQTLKDANIIRSTGMFEATANIMFGKKSVVAGDFTFERKHSVFYIAKAVTGGLFGRAQVKVTIPEGSTVQEIARSVQKMIPSWNADEFVAKAKGREGYLFPETYFVFKTTTPDAFIARLEKEYETRVAPLRSDMTAARRTESQIIIMASLLEKEARNADEAKVIAGILWKRLDKGMPLQVDAPFLYVLNKTSEQLKAADLQKDGPYNTYTRKGLPVGPIGNPGVAMITAAIHPQVSEYWYYLHDAKGGIHYAKTYQEHVTNKKKYLP